VFESISSEGINTQSLWLGIRVRRHFRFDAKKVVFFRMFHIDAKRKNLKRNENGTKKKKRKTAIIFASKRNEAKQKQKTANIFASK
jgi:hypothetical protein